MVWKQTCHVEVLPVSSLCEQIPESTMGGNVEERQTRSYRSAKDLQCEYTLAKICIGRKGKERVTGAFVQKQQGWSDELPML